MSFRRPMYREWRFRRKRVKSHELGGQLISPFRELTRSENFARKIPMVSPLVWHVAPSCWKQRSSISYNSNSNDPSCPKTAPNSYTLRIERLFKNRFWVFRAPNAIILLINVASKVKMSFIAHNDFLVKFRFFFMHFQLPIGKDTTFLMVSRLESLC